MAYLSDISCFWDNKTYPFLNSRRERSIYIQPPGLIIYEFENAFFDQIVDLDPSFFNIRKEIQKSFWLKTKIVEQAVFIFLFVWLSAVIV